MIKKIKFKYILLVILSFSLGFITQDKDKYYQIAKSIDVFGRIFKQVNNNYVDNIDVEQFMLAGINGMLSSLDPYTVYLNKNSKNDFNLLTSGKYGGIGVTVGLQNGKVTVIDLLEGYPAQRQGIRIGDVIVKIDTQEISSKNYNKLSNYLKKVPGTEINLTVEREGFPNPITFNLITEIIEIKNVTYFGFVPDISNNAYIKLSGFSRTAGEEVKNAISKLQKQKEIKSIVLDLRGNPGGLLESAIEVCDNFLKKGKLIVSVKGKNNIVSSKMFAKEKPVAENLPLAVLINGGSASASEIVTGAIQDHDRGIVVGTESFGKGLVQTVVPLSNSASLKITTGKYYTPSGRSIQRIDYSHNNKVFIDHDKLKRAVFKTDNKRKVYSAEGIKPDSVVYSNDDSRTINTLMARGMFFKFATSYYNSHPETDYITLSADTIFTAFKKYLSNKKFAYNNRFDNIFNMLKNEINKYAPSDSLTMNLNNLKIELNNMKDNILLKYKPDIVSEIRQEFAARMFGRKGRIKESLKNDLQFDTAIKILNNQKLYNKILKIIE